VAKRKQPDYWSEPWQYHHVSGPILWAVIVYVLGGGVLYMAHVDPRYVAAVGGGTALLSPLVTLYKRFSFLLMGAITGLLTWTTATTPWARPPVFVTIAGTALFGMAYHALRKQERDEETEEQKKLDSEVKRGRYVKMIERACGKKPGTTGLTEISRTPTVVGHDVLLKLPSNGSITYRQLRQLVPQLETAADVRPGTFRFEEEATAGKVLLHVLERDLLAENFPLEFDRGPKSIHDPIPLGRYADGGVCVVTFREVAALLVGIKGRGKSALINTHLAHLTGCTDAVVWMLDGKGGRTARAWLAPFLEAIKQQTFETYEDARPALDWVAICKPDDMTEAEAMLSALNYAIEARYSGDGDKIVPSDSQPSIILIVEEASVITGTNGPGATKRAQMLQNGVLQGRSEACDSMICSQRATVTALANGDTKSNLDLRYGLGVTEEQDARMIFPDSAMASSLLALGTGDDYKGVFLMQAPNSSRVMPAKGFFVDPSTIYGIAKTNSQYTARLDQHTADFVHARLTALGVPGGYYGRWQRYMDRTKTVPAGITGVRLEHSGGTPERSTGTESVPGGTPERSTRTPDGTPERSTGTPERSTGTPERSTGTPERSTGTPERSGQRGRDIVEQAIARDRSRREQAAFDDLLSANGWDGEGWNSETPAAAVPAGNVPAILRLMLQVFQARDAEQLHTETLLEHLPGDLTAKRLGVLMGHCNVSAEPEPFIWNGKRARGYTRDKIETAIKGQTWNSRAFDWEP
jgi:hypothetical protein